MANAVEPLIDLNAQIKEAAANDNYPRILYLDTQRRAIIQSLATNPDFKSDSRSLTVIKDTVEQNQRLISEITDRMTSLTNQTSNKIRMLRSYRQFK